MTTTDREALAALLARLQDIHTTLSEYYAGISVLHLEASIAALESRLLWDGAPPIGQVQSQLHASSAR